MIHRMKHHPRPFQVIARSVKAATIATLCVVVPAGCVHSRALPSPAADAQSSSSSSSAAARGTGHRLVAVDVFGNRTVPSATLRALVPFTEGTVITLDRVLSSLERAERSAATGPLPPGVPEHARIDFALHLLGTRIERRALATAPIVFAQFGPVTSDNGTMTLVLDVAERGDPGLSGFRASPEQDVLLPGGLVQLWEDYRNAIFAAVRAGNHVEETMESGHWRTLDPKTHAAEEQFLVLVRDHLEAVRAAALRHRDPNTRQMCAYLLSWSPDPVLAVETLLEAIRDSLAYVRNEAARALIPLARLSVETGAFEVPIEPIVDLLNRPTATDRNKAAAILLQLAADPLKRAAIQAHAGKRLEAMASSRAPFNHDVALRVLDVLGNSP